LFGEYALELDGSGVQLVSVWFTREPVVMDETWGPFSCPGLSVGFTLFLSDTAGEGQLVLASSTAGYRLVISFPSGFGSPCRFIPVFIERFMFFMRNAAREEDLSLPAFLQL
jgi:hypothetical protein